MSIPLVQNNEKDSINTSIIAIKKNLERINSILGLVDSGSDIDTSEFVKKSDIVDVVQSGNMNPVTSNAVVPVDTVTSGNMHSVTSNAVARTCLKISDIEVVHEIVTTGNDSIASLSKVGGWVFDIWVLGQSAVVMQGRSGLENWVSVEKYNGNKMPNTQVELYYLWTNVSFSN